MKTFSFMALYYIRPIVTPGKDTPRNIGKETEFNHWLYEGCYMPVEEQNFSPPSAAVAIALRKLYSSRKGRKVCKIFNKAISHFFLAEITGFTVL